MNESLFASQFMANIHSESKDLTKEMLRFLEVRTEENLTCLHAFFHVKQALLFPDQTSLACGEQSHSDLQLRLILFLVK